MLLRFVKNIFLFVTALSIFFISAQQEIIKKCPNCQFLEKREAAKFCMHCGYKLLEVEMIPTLMCSQCNIPIDKDGKYCTVCGQKGTLLPMPIAKETYEPKAHDADRKENYEPKPHNSNHKETPSQPSQLDDTLQIPIYPNSTFLKEYNIDEGLYYTSKQRDIVRKLFICHSSMEDVEQFYRGQYEDISVIKTVAYNTANALNLKVQLPQHEIHILLYELIPVQNDKIREDKKKWVKSQLEPKLKPIRNIEKKIAGLQQLFRDGKVTYPQIEGNIKELQEQHNLMTNSSSYWNSIMMEQVLDLKKNLLLITVVVPKK